MTDDKVRRVSLTRQHFRLGEYFEKVKDNPNGTHMLVPVEDWEDTLADANYAATLVQQGLRTTQKDVLEIERLNKRIENAESLIAHAVQIMTPEQVGKWTGVRAWQEGGEDE